MTTAPEDKQRHIAAIEELLGGGLSSGLSGVPAAAPTGPPSPPTHVPPPGLGAGGGTHYARGVLQGEAAKVAATAKGSRNKTLHDAAFRVAMYVGAGQLEFNEAYGVLHAAGLQCGLSEREVATALRKPGEDGGKGPWSTGMLVNPQLVGTPAFAHLQVAKAADTPAGQAASAFGQPLPELSAEEIELQQAQLFAVAVAEAAYRMRVSEQARAALSAEKAGGMELPEGARLDVFLATADEELLYRVDQVWPIGGRIVFAAAQKSGKSTALGNLIRSLVDGHKFLGHFATAKVERVVLFDNELDENMLRRWLRDQGVENTTAVEVFSMRGRMSSFNVLDPAVRTRWAQHIGPADVLLFDCLRPALDALGLKEDKEAGRLLSALDELTVQAGIAETVVVHHMGHVDERARGDSGILGWPDANWKLVRQDLEDDRSPRYFSAYGRGVDVPETLLSYEPTTRWLTAVGGSRREAKEAQKIAGLMHSVVEVVRGHPDGIYASAIEKELRRDNPGMGLRNGMVSKAAKEAVECGLLSAGSGPGTAIIYQPIGPGAVS